MPKHCKASRNRTIELSAQEITHYAAMAVGNQKKYALEETINKIIHGDSFKIMPKLAPNCVDLMIVDPPYNLTKTFGQNIFRQRNFEEYKKWLDDWLSLTVPLLKENASIYICSDWKTSIAIPEIAGKYFILQNRISWEREKGRGAKNNWKNCLEDIWFFTKSSYYTFNTEAVKIQRPVLAPYRDTNGKPKDWLEVNNEKMRLTYPSNIWTDISVPFWSMSENTNHPTQKPIALLERIIKASSNEGDLILDPFSGTFTTSYVANSLGRKSIGIDISEEYFKIGLRRVLRKTEYNGESLTREPKSYERKNIQHEQEVLPLFA